MELVIEVDEELYRAYKGRPPRLGDEGMDMIAQAIANGTPLPKGHGRLIDADKLSPDVVTRSGNLCAISQGQINEAATIVEADKPSPDTFLGIMR